MNIRRRERVKIPLLAQERRLTLMVWTVLTWIRDMAMLEKICPPTWKTPIGNVFWKTALFGMRNLEKRTTGLMKSKQYSATKPN